jgi:hypothetical protein
MQGGENILRPVFFCANQIVASRKHPERVSLTLSGLTGGDMFFACGNGVNYLRLASPFFNDKSGILSA